MKSGKLVHEFPANENFSSPIRVLEQSTAIDVIGVGMANGQIHLRNIKFDKVLCSFRQSGQITALAFR
jgi:U3 small nucleolar RNA-associated protein 21